MGKQYMASSPLRFFSSKKMEDAEQTKPNKPYKYLLLNEVMPVPTTLRCMQIWYW